MLEGEGVWTVVDGDPVAMRRGDLLLTAGWRWHEHHNTADAPMVWLDGLDIPLVSALDAGFFEFGPDEVTDRSTPERSRNERLWGHPGLRPVGAPDARTSPLMAYRWEHTDAALAAQLELDAAGHPGAVGPGHAAVRFTNPTTGGDALVTLRMEMHRLAAGAQLDRAPHASARRSGRCSTATARSSSTVGRSRSPTATSSPSRRGARSASPPTTSLDLFMFSDAPVYEALDLADPEGARA